MSQGTAAPVEVRCEEQPRRVITPGLAITLVAAVLGGRFLLLIWKYSVNIINSDQWDFYSPLFDKAPLWKIFRYQHGPHREGIGLVLDKVLLDCTAWNSRVEPLSIGIAIVVATVGALLLKRKLFGSLEFSDIAIPVIFLTLVQFEGLVVTPNSAYAGLPLLLIVAYWLAVLQSRPVVRYVWMLLLNFLLVYTGFGFFMGFVTLAVCAMEIWWRIRHKTMLSVVLPVSAFLIASATLASFFIGYRWSPAVDCFVFPDPRPVLYPWFVGLMFSGFLGLKKPAILAGVVGIVLLGVAAIVLALQAKPLWNRSKDVRLNLVIAGLLTYSLLFSASTAIGRVCLELPSAAQSSRYTTLLIPGFLALYLFLLSLPKAPYRTALIWALLIGALPGCVLKTKGFHYTDRKRAWKACYLQTEDIDYCDHVTQFRLYFWPEATRLKGKLDYLKRNHLNLFADSR